MNPTVKACNNCTNSLVMQENGSRVLLGLPLYHHQQSGAKHIDPFKFKGLSYATALHRATLKNAHVETFTAAHDLAAAMSDATGESWNLDHIAPLRGKNVCGLNVAENLEITPEKYNSRKGNK